MEMDRQRAIQIIKSGYLEGGIHPSGTIYLGGMYEGLPHGKGIIILLSGKAYEYRFNQGKIDNGDSIVLYPDGSFYEGKLSAKGTPYGKGIIRNLDGEVYFDGNWYYDFHPKVIWRCGTLVWFEYGRVVHNNGYILFPAICLHPYSFVDSTKEWVMPVNVMFPHLQDLGCPQNLNQFNTTGQTTPESAVKAAGFNNIDDYRKYIADSDLRVMENVVMCLEIVELSMKVFSVPGLFSLFNSKSHGHSHDSHNISHQLFEWGLKGSKLLFEREIDKRKELLDSKIAAIKQHPFIYGF
jgi:hypothetical protein